MNSKKCGEVSTETHEILFYRTAFLSFFGKVREWVGVIKYAIGMCMGHPLLRIENIDHRLAKS